MHVKELEQKATYGEILKHPIIHFQIVVDVVA
jgi:hypothetical protein